MNRILEGVLKYGCHCLACPAVEPWYPLRTAGQARQWHPNRRRSEFQNTFSGTKPRQRCRRKASRGFTLLELVVSSVAGSLLVAGLSGSLYIASQSFDRNTGAMNQSQAQQILGEMMADINQAIRFTERTATAVTFTVPDRTGNGQPETIRYAWEGAAGNPLTYEYNGSAVVMLARDVQHFDLSYLTRTAMARESTPPDAIDRLLFVVTNPANPSIQEAIRKKRLESWGYTLTMIDSSDTQANYDTAVAANDVVYISEDVGSVQLDTKLVAAPIGVVNEESDLNDDFGFSIKSVDTTGTTINITNNEHYITSEFAVGSLQLVTTDQLLTSIEGPFAAGMRSLGQWDATTGGLAVMESRAMTWDSTVTAGRRVALPWGGDNFDFNTITGDGLTMLRRAIEWAAGAGEVAGVVFKNHTEVSTSKGVTSLALDLPVGTRTDDLLIACVATNGDLTSSLAPPDGWTRVSLEQEQGVLTFGVWWKLAAADDLISITQTFTGVSDEKCLGWIMRFAGHNVNEPINVVATEAGKDISPVSPAVGTSVDDAMILRLGGFYDKAVLASGETGLLGHNPITMFSSVAGSENVSGGAGYTSLIAFGDSGSSNFSLKMSTPFRTVTLAIAPDPGN